ncbi:LysR family transcriptional regulator [Kiloniella sp. b19]|uniref:LysR family transcriptional regulator n=1 Tax=Kiloniella sp. GXU_MW_B19 TaxID=3141326 RepID=UPI0031CE6CE1
MRKLPNLNVLRTFEAAARHLNFTAAAQELGMTQAAVSLHIKVLETQLGEKLFNRQPRNLRLTKAAEAYLPAIRRALNDLTLSTNGLFGPSGSNEVNLKLPITTMVLWLAPRLPAFWQEHPDIKLKITTSIFTEAPDHEINDIEIRFGHGQWPGVRCEKLSSEAIVPIIHGDLAPAGQPFDWKDIKEEQLIHILGFDDHWARYFSAQSLNLDSSRPRLVVDTTAIAFEMVTLKAGLACVLKRFADTMIQKGEPVVTSGPPVVLEQGHYLIESTGNLAPRSEVAIFLNWLRERFNEEA